MDRLRPDQQAQLIREYENEYEPGSEPIEDFVSRKGVSKQQLYNVLRRHGIKPKSQRKLLISDLVLPNLSAEELVDKLLEELVNARRTIRALTIELAKLRGE